MARDTGFPDADAENDFTRLRRQAELARLSAWFTRAPADVNTILPFDEVVAALGRTGETNVGLVVVDREHRYRFANRAYRELLGLPPDPPPPQAASTSTTTSRSADRTGVMRAGATATAVGESTRVT